MQRKGSATNPGLLFVMNISSQTQVYDIATKWNNQKLVDYSRNVKEEPTTNTSGNVSITVPAKSFGVWSTGK